MALEQAAGWGADCLLSAQSWVNGGQCKGKYAKAKGGLGCRKLQNPRSGAKRGGPRSRMLHRPLSPSHLCAEFSSRGGKHPGSPRLGHPNVQCSLYQTKKRFRALIERGPVLSLEPWQLLQSCIICIVAARGIGGRKRRGHFSKNYMGIGSRVCH